MAGGYEEAIRCGCIAVDENPTFTSNLRYLAASLAASGKLQEARAVGRALLARQPDFNLQAYRARIPFKDDALRALHLNHLRLAGIPSNP